ncbi:hypothetical protein [Endozoicomonas sp.]|uniref:hypothetical protein n=1 Tax=Endozoicomonas sp. TaxID=1892382 RepID=UPI0028873904|nr:hypothetical protein [Endozoicomonas sp.]
MERSSGMSSAGWSTLATDNTGTQAIRAGGSATFSGHQIKTKEGGETVMATARNCCPYCHVPLSDKSKNTSISVVNVNTIYHTGCLEKCLNTPSGASQEQLELARNTTHYLDIDSLTDKINSLQSWCSNDLCRTSGSFQELSKRADCPYPLSQMDCEQSITIKAKTLSSWLKTEFENAGYSEVATTHSNKNNDCMIRVVAKDPGIGCYKKTSSYFYKAKTIVSGENTRECFKILLKQLNADIAVRQFSIDRPNAFDESTDVYIKQYDVPNNCLFISVRDETHVIPLNYVFDLHTRECKESEFRTTLDRLDIIGLNYDELLSNGLPSNAGYPGQLANPAHNDLPYGEDFPG